MEKEKWIYHQKKDNIYIAKVFKGSKEYYIGGFKNKKDALQARDQAYKDILDGNTSKYKSRINNINRQVDSELEWWSQYISYPSHMEQPEYRFRYAILMRALRDLCQDENDQRYKQSRKWVLGQIESEETFSFEEICDLFRLNANAVREKILSINEEDKKRISSQAD